MAPTILRGRDLHVLLEDAVEVTLIVEPAPDRNLGEWLSRARKLVSCARDAQVSNVFSDRTRVDRPEGLRQMHGMHGGNLRELLERQSLTVVVVKHLAHFLKPRWRM